MGVAAMRDFEVTPEAKLEMVRLLCPLSPEMLLHKASSSRQGGSFIYGSFSPLHLALKCTPQSCLYRLLHSGADPTEVVPYGFTELERYVITSAAGIAVEAASIPNGCYTSFSLATNTPLYAWSLEVCEITSELIERSLQWDESSNVLFPPSFRKGIKHILGLQLALRKATRPTISLALLLIIVRYLPRDWGFQPSNSAANESRASSVHMDMPVEGHVFELESVLELFNKHKVAGSGKIESDQALWRLTTELLCEKDMSVKPDLGATQKVCDADVETTPFTFQDFLKWFCDSFGCTVKRLQSRVAAMDMIAQAEASCTDPVCDLFKDHEGKARGLLEHPAL